MDDGRAVREDVEMRLEIEEERRTGIFGVVDFASSFWSRGLGDVYKRQIFFEKKKAEIGRKSIHRVFSPVFVGMVFTSKFSYSSS